MPVEVVQTFSFEEYQKQLMYLASLPKANEEVVALSKLTAKELLHYFHLRKATDKYRDKIVVALGEL